MYIVGGGNYDLDRTDVPINRSLREDGAHGIRLADDVWIGTHSIVLDGVSVGEGTAIAAGSVVTGDIPGRSIAAGAPARIVKERPCVPVASVSASTSTGGGTHRDARAAGSTTRDLDIDPVCH